MNKIFRTKGIYNHAKKNYVWRKPKPKTLKKIEKNRWNNKLFHWRKKPKLID